MVEVFGDLLPAEILTRQTKAHFQAVAWNRHTSAFIRDWDGTGIDPALVDVEVLRRHWQANDSSTQPQTPYAYQSAVLLQAAWVAQHGGSTPLTRTDAPVRP